MPSASHGEEHQHDHHRNGDETAAAAAVSTATAAIVVVSTATAAGRAAKVAGHSPCRLCQSSRNHRLPLYFPPSEVCFASSEVILPKELSHKRLFQYLFAILYFPDAQIEWLFHL